MCRLERLTFLLALSSLFAACGGDAPKGSQKGCVQAMVESYAAVAEAQRREIARCIKRGSDGELGSQTIEACFLADGLGEVSAREQETLARETDGCATAPQFGYAGGAAANAAGVSTELELIHSLLGDDVDAVVATNPVASECQQSVVDRAGQCTNAFIEAYLGCSESIEDAAGLVRCKNDDPEFKIAQACETGLEGAITESCADQNTDALVPGCAGHELALCIRGHARAAGSRGLNRTVDICPTLLPGEPEPPAPEPIDFAVVPLPANVTEVSFPWWTVDGSRIIFSTEIDGFVGSQIATIAEDGSDFQCLTCGLVVPDNLPLIKPIPFADGMRVSMRVGPQGQAGTFQQHGILECSPSVVDCQVAALIPLEIPSQGDENVVGGKREVRPAPDNNHIALTQLRTSEIGGPTLISVLGELNRLPDRYEMLNTRVISDLGEFKQFSRDGQHGFVASFASIESDALNPDTLRIDLSDGKIIERITSHPAFDEPVEFSPDDEWYVVGSWRNNPRAHIETFTQLVRPPLITMGLEQLGINFFFVRWARDLYPLRAEPWLLDKHGERGDYVGQLVGVADDNWQGMMIPNWHPDGTRILMRERALDESLLSPEELSTRLVVATLSSRAPVISPVVSSPTPSLDWAPLLAGYTPPAFPEPVSRAGAFSGNADVELAPGETARLEVTFTNYSDDGRTFVDGVETVRFTAGGILSTSNYEADLTLRGCEQGYLQAVSVEVGGLDDLSGTVSSEVDGLILTIDQPR